LRYSGILQEGAVVVKRLLEEFSEEAIRAFVQKNADYYLAKWRVMAQKSSKASWNWAAALFGGWFYQSWFFYRKMFLYGLAAFTLFSGVSTSLGLLLGRALAGLGARGEVASATLTLVAVVLTLLPVALMGLYGNYLYGKLKAMRERAGSEEELLQLAAARGGTSVLLVVGGFLVELLILFGLTLTASVVVALL